MSLVVSDGLAKAVDGQKSQEVGCEYLGILLPEELDSFLNRKIANAMSHTRTITTDQIRPGVSGNEPRQIATSMMGVMIQAEIMA